MNLTSADPTAPPPPPPPQPPRSSFSCDRHPIEQFTGFCPSCLCERLTTLDNSSSNTPSTSRRPSSASAAAAAVIKSLFSSTSKPSYSPPQPPLRKPSKVDSAFPELRRTKSFSAAKNEALGLSFEPQRKSCDVRARNTLWGLFTLDDENKFCDSKSAYAGSSSQQNPQISKLIGSSVANKPVFEETENEHEDDFANVDQAETHHDYNDGDDGDEIRPHLENSTNAVETETAVKMRERIDLDKKSSGGGFWAAASVFSKKWHKWRRKQKVKKQNNGQNMATLPVEKPISKQYRETQSEIADYGYGRRSCDTDPRFSLDAARISFDDGRYSFDEPRASWDGYLIGRSFSRIPPMVSVMEDGDGVGAGAVSRADMQIHVEEVSMEGGESVEPGGCVQTKEYYLDSSSSRRRKSLDRSNSIRKTAAAAVAVAAAANAPANADCFHSESLRDDCCETFELGSGVGVRDSSNSLIGNGDRKEVNKSRRWSWRIWGFIQRKNGANKGEGEEKSGRSMFRSNSSVSWRNGNQFEMKRKKRKDEIVLERNRSARYSPSHVENGLLRFYLTPMRGSRRGGTSKIKPNNSQSIARSVLRLY